MLTPEGREAVIPRTLELEDWDDRLPRIVIVNNSSLNQCDPLPGLGVLHGAELLYVPNPGMPRIINSTMLVTATDAPGRVDEVVHIFSQTTEISGSIL